jgi:hypothetical protein
VTIYKTKQTFRHQMKQMVIAEDEAQMCSTTSNTAMLVEDKRVDHGTADSRQPRKDILEEKKKYPTTTPAFAVPPLPTTAIRAAAITSASTSSDKTSASAKTYENGARPGRQTTRTDSTESMNSLGATPAYYSTASPSPSSYHDENEARRIAQELEDAEMAQRLSLYEREAESRRTLQQPPRRRTSGLMVGRILPLLCCGLAIVIALLFILGVFKPQKVPFMASLVNGGGRNPGNRWIDPFGGNHTTGTIGGGDGGVGSSGGGGSSGGSSSGGGNFESCFWGNNGQIGLTMEILNAAQDKWTSFLQTAVNEYNN